MSQKNLGAVALLVLSISIFGCAGSTGRIRTAADWHPPLTIPEIDPSTRHKEVEISLLEPEPTVRVLVSKRRRRGIHKVPMETYLAGVIGSEMSRRWPKEALKAQAVAARSYALYRMADARKSGRRFDVVATQGDQVFKPGHAKDPYLRSLVEETRGQVLMKDGKVVQAFYSSTCGGKIRSALMAGLATDYPILGNRSDNYCRFSPFRHWSFSVSPVDMTKRFRRAGLRFEGLRSVRVVDRDESGYVRKVELADERGKRRVLNGDSFRSLMGSMRLKSLLFNIRENGDGSYSFIGRGFGHGVGMCQYGAKTMAQRGHSYRSILSKYYPRVSVTRIYQ